MTSHIEPDRHHISKAELKNVLHRLGTPQANIDEIVGKLPDPVDLDEAGAYLQNYGFTRDAVMSLLGGSP